MIETNVRDHPLDGKPFCGCYEPHLELAADVGSAAAWPNGLVTWALAGDWNLPGLSRQDIEDVFTWAFAQWEAVCGLRAAKAKPGERPLATFELKAIDGPGKVLAWSELADGTTNPKRLRVDPTEGWTVATTPGQRLDLGRVLAHEIGHLIGVGHLADGNLMQKTYSTAIRVPQPGDIAEAVKRYGPPKAKPAPVPPDKQTPAGSILLPIDSTLPPGATLAFPADVVVAALKTAGYRVERS